MYVLHYDVVDDFVNRRMPFREEHLRRVHEAHARGELVMAGPLGDPPDAALLIFRGDSPAAAESFARHDPYVVEGLVIDWSVRPWNVVIGGDGGGGAR